MSKKVKCFVIDEVNKETVMLAKTDHRCANCEYYVAYNGGDNSGYCKLRKNINTLNVDSCVCRSWVKKTFKDDLDDW